MFDKVYAVPRQAPNHQGQMKRTTCSAAARASTAPISKMRSVLIMGWILAALMRSMLCSMHSTRRNAARSISSDVIEYRCKSRSGQLCAIVPHTLIETARWAAVTSISSDSCSSNSHCS
jgi:hypothetical protein